MRSRHSHPCDSWSLCLRLCLLLCGAVLLTGCTSPEAVRLFEQLVAKNQAILQAQGMDPSNRLLIQGVDGNLYTIHPDGSERAALTNDATPRRQYLQPTWSPSGSQIAWAEIDNRSGTLESALTVSQFDGSVRARFETPFAPFYLQWSPDEEHLAFLSNWRNLDQSTATIALRLVDLAPRDDAGSEAENSTEKSTERGNVSTLVQGQPLYLTWSPTGDRLLIHIDNDRLEYWNVAGDGTALVQTFADFPAPAWSANGEQLLYALGEPGAQQLVLADTEGNLTQEITDYHQKISFSLSPANERVAYAITPANVATAAFGPLYVVELATNRTRELTRAPVMAFFWSPNGDKLAYLEIDDREAQPRLRWYVWDGTQGTPYAAMVPSRAFLQAYITFFDQYERSMTIWAPDGSAFAYSAIDPTYGNTIWVQELDQAAPQRISRGVFVAWSPN